MLDFLLALAVELQHHAVGPAPVQVPRFARVRHVRTVDKPGKKQNKTKPWGDEGAGGEGGWMRAAGAATQLRREA